MISVLSPSSSVHDHSSPKLMQPRQIRLTSIPVSPSVVYSMPAVHEREKTFARRNPPIERTPSYFIQGAQ